MRQILLAWIGGGLAMLVVAMLAALSGAPLILGSFGATCVLVFGYPDAPFSQPRAVLGGHLLATAIGLTALQVGGDGPAMLGFATGTAIAAMMWLGITHPPAGSNPVIVFLLHAKWGFLVAPTAIGAVIIIIWALGFHRLTRRAAYPAYW